MLFRKLKKNSRRLVGVVTALIVTSVLTLGFMQSYMNTKNRFVKKVDLVEVSIFAEKSAPAPILYESVPSVSCIKQLTFPVVVVASSSVMSSSSSSSSVAVSSSPASVSASSFNTKSSAAAVKKVIKKIPSPPEPILISATSPSCIGVSAFPVGYEKLGENGFVTLELNLAKTGRIERGLIDTSSGFADLDAAALKQVSETWKFEPCKKAGSIVACKQLIRFRWQLPK